LENVLSGAEQRKRLNAWQATNLWKAQTEMNGHGLLTGIQIFWDQCGINGHQVAVRAPGIGTFVSHNAHKMRPLPKLVSQFSLTWECGKEMNILPEHWAWRTLLKQFG
jgi:hypothetical protein